ncbi:MAG: hypothetical protein ABW168_19985 [Sedimenticola sp.]
MKPIKYVSGELVKVGDIVEVREYFWKKYRGCVVYVYDPEKPILPRGDNEYGISIRLDNGCELWGGDPGKEVTFLERKE